MASLVCSVDVARPVREVYDQWTLLEELPGVMPSVVSVRQLDDRTTHWTIRVRKEQREFGAVITEQVPDMRIAWRGEGHPAQSGVVTFHRLGPDRSRATVQLDWEPEGLFDKVGQRAGLVERALRADLEAFRDHVESRTAPAPGWRGTVGRAADGAEEPGAPGPRGSSARPSRRGPGHGADSPTELPKAGFVQVLKRTKDELKRDNIPVVAAGVAFFVFLALVPALAAVVSVYGLVADPDDVEEQLSGFIEALPAEAGDLLSSQLEAVTAQGAGGLGLAVVIGLLASLWSASRGVNALVSALNIAYDEEESRKGVKLKAWVLLLTVGVALGIVGLVAAMTAVGMVADQLGAAGAWALTIARWPILAGALVLGLAALYRFGPDRSRAEWRWVTPGAGLAAVLLVLGSFAFSIYVENFGNFNETYGTLGAIVVLLLWLNLSAFVVVLGAELDAELERQTAQDTTGEPDQPMGQRGAHVADTVAGERV